MDLMNDSVSQVNKGKTRLDPRLMGYQPACTSEQDVLYKSSIHLVYFTINCLFIVKLCYI